MRVINVSNLAPGMKVGRPVVDDTGQILLNKGVNLTEEYIRALQAKKFTGIYITDENIEVTIDGDDDLNPVTRAKAISTIRKAFEIIEHQVPRLRDQSIEQFAKVFSTDAMKSLLGKGGPLDSLQGVVSGLMAEVLNRTTLAGLTSIKSVDQQLYSHSVDVCVVAMMIGRSVGLDESKLRQLAIGSLLHDIGKLFMNKAANERSQVRQHTLLGYELLKNCPNPDILAPHVALEHHEWQDGSGEPRGLMGSNALERDRNLPTPVPTLVGEIAAVANVYDNMLSGSHSRPPMTPDTVIQSMRAVAGTHLNRAIVNAFVRLAPVYPLGTEVIVRSEPYKNFTAIVSKVNPTRLDKPVIILLKDNQGRPVAIDELNLAEDRNKDIQIRCKVT